MTSNSPSLTTKRRPIGEILVQMGLVTPAELQAALVYKQQHGLKLGQALVALHLVTQPDLALTLRDQGAVHCIHLLPEIVDREIAARLGEERSRSSRAIAVNQIAGIVTVAMEDPTDGVDLDALSDALNAPILAVHADPECIERCLDMLFGVPQATGGAPHAAATPVHVEYAMEEEPASSRDDSAELLAQFLEDAVVANASSVHLEPRADEVIVRMRVEGELHGSSSVSKARARALLGRIKLLGNLDPARTDLPQEGRARAFVRGADIELRIATSPSLHGEGAVVRILDCGRRLVQFSDLPFDARQYADVERMVEGGGLVLVAGPSGQGRTSTLYALLQRFDATRRKLVTVEDPVEDHLEGVLQMNVNARGGFGFAEATRAALAQDPDVLLVGEIRDTQTAEAAIQAALAGKLVLSTLHATGAAEAVTRMCDLGIEPYLLADALRGVVGQRLVRRLCTACRQTSTPTAEQHPRFAPAALPPTIFTARGCEQCGYLGYRGRIALYEVFAVEVAQWDAIRTRSPAHALRGLARASGATSLREDGLAKAARGETTLEEVHAATVRG